ncbi:patatin-like phospholipase family protein [Mesorhizobium sp. 113-1-2]|uniref:patatin-like phospholipase family protein n=1 Tax=Mesorhizobium sp. 113-1-2 TaxID=2744515 RepID=UPI0019268658|nr:patatin-like phospholipase family protein [Mesorhizobium sp. 113-1-2]
MHIQTGIETSRTSVGGAGRAMDDRQPVDIVVANDAHGAFVWGVLDRLLDQPDLCFGNITASGFGAMEAAVLAYGLALGGQRGARTALTNFWRRVSHASMLMAEKASPLRSILEQTIEIAEIRKKTCPVKLNIVASNARTDAVKVFPSDQLSIDIILAAATVPFLFPAVEIDGDTYWGDGDVSVLPSFQAIEPGAQLIIAGKPSGSMTPCSDHRVAAMPGTPNLARTQTIFDTAHRAGATMFLRPWTDWGELTAMRDRGRKKVEDWLMADHFADDRSAVEKKGNMSRRLPPA